MSGLLLNYNEQGEGEALIVLHGLFGSSQNWQSLSKRFARDYRVITLDLRNHGESFHDEAMDYTLMSNDVIELMDSLHMGSAHLLGHSMGGKIAMKIAQLHPARIDKLVVADIAPVAYSHSYDEIIEPVLSLDLSPVSSRGEVDTALAAFIPDQRIRLFLLLNLAFEQGRAYWKINWISIRQNMQALLEYDDISAWGIENSSLFIRGEQSDYVKPEHWGLIQRHFPNAQQVTLPDAGHWLHAEQPEAFYDAVSIFLRS